jgi:anaerobic dimethyl sulfoxide reductase subunit A
MVVHEQFMTATARFADIVLPSSTLLERNDIIAGGATPFYGRVNKIIEPLYESKSHLEIAEMLAAHLGLSEYGAKTDEELVRQIADGSSIPDYTSFKENGIYRIKLKEPFVSFSDQIKDPANNPFPTPSGKIEIYSEQLAKLDDPLIPAIPKYLEPWEGLNDSLTMRYPLQLINKHVKRRAHSQLETLPWLKEVEMHAMQINTLDAETRNIHDGDVVKVFNDRGIIVIPAKVTERIMLGVICLPQGAWYAPDENGYDRGGCANTLTREQHSPCGALVTNSCLVQVEKYGV